MSKLVVLAGVPGSGKSYISLLIKDRMKNGHVYIVSSDYLRSQICGNQQCFDYEDLMWKMYYEMAKVYANDKDGIVILDSTNSKRIYRIDKVKTVSDLFDEVDLVVFKLNKGVVMRQNIEREFPVPSEVLDHLYDDFEKVNEEDYSFFDKVYEVDNLDYKPIIDELVK